MPKLYLDRFVGNEKPKLINKAENKNNTKKSIKCTLQIKVLVTNWSYKFKRIALTQIAFGLVGGN